ncbi:MAG: hypothetical protein ACREVW_10490, partial [Burkholderiales bacterium]
IHVPAGTYRINTSVQLYYTGSGVFGPGPKIFGDGIGVTIFDTRVAAGAMFDIDSNFGDAHATFHAVLGVELSGFTIKTLGAPTTATGIKLRTTFMGSLKQIHIIGLSGNGIEVPCTVGDNDGSNMLNFEQLRIENCGGWGIKADAASGRNEISFIYMKQVFIQSCGTTSGAATPPSGGMIWKGQIISTEECAFVTNENCGLFIPGQAGAANAAYFQNTTFENNKKRGFYSTGLSLLKTRNVQFYNNDAFTATNAFELDGASFIVRNVDIDGVVVRATAGNNAYTAFKISGANAILDSCRVKNVTWDNFDYAGQTRFNGWQFDAIPQQCEFAALGTTLARLRPVQLTTPGAKGNVMPLRLRGGAGGTPSTSGEWVQTQLTTVGLSITNASLAASTLYYAYMYDNNGSVTLELSTTATALDGATGYRVKSGDATKLYVGQIKTDAGALFELTSNYQAPLFLNGNYLWVDSSTKLRVSATFPTSDTAGTVVGTQV